MALEVARERRAPAPTLASSEGWSASGPNTASIWLPRVTGASTSVDASSSSGRDERPAPSARGGGSRSRARTRIASAPSPERDELAPELGGQPASAPACVAERGSRGRAPTSSAISASSVQSKCWSERRSIDATGASGGGCARRRRCDAGVGGRRRRRRVRGSWRGAAASRSSAQHALRDRRRGGPPWPPCSTSTATTISGASAGAKPTNQAWSR